MEELLAKFEAVMSDYNESYTSAKDDKDRSIIDKEYGSIIDKAEIEMETGMDAFLKAEDEALAKEHQASEDELAALEKEGAEKIEDEVEYLKEKADSAKYIAKRYNLSNTKKNGYSTRQIYEHVTGQPAGKQPEKELSEIIFKTITE